MPPAMIVNPMTPRKHVTVKPFCLSCFADLKHGQDSFCTAFCRDTFMTDTSIAYDTTDPADGDWEEDQDYWKEGDDEELRVVWRPVRVARAAGWNVSAMRSLKEGDRRAE